MRFVDTKRFSPVIFGDDKPWEYDLFHHEPESVPETSKGYQDYIETHNIVTDTEWWNEQYRRCVEGYTVPAAIEKGGDAYVDEKHCFWNDSTTETRYLKKYDYTIPPNSCYIPQYDLLIRNREVHITGEHYFYLNFWKIYRKMDDAKRKDVLPPKFLDTDFFFWRRLDMMVEQEKDGIEAKSRQQGMSEKLSCKLGYNYTFHRSSLNIVAGGMSDDADYTMERTQRGLRQLVNTQFYKERDKNKSDYWRAKNFRSEIRSISCKDNAQALSRFSPSFVVYEEVGKWKAGLIKEAREFVEASLNAEGVKTGYALYIGTGGDMEEGAQDLQDFHYDPDAINALSFENEWDRDENVTARTGHFTPADLFTIIDDDGNSFKQLGREKVLADRKTKKPKDRYTHITQQALYASDAFLIKTGGFFGEEVANWCNERLAHIQTHREEQIVERGWLRWKDRKDPWKGVYFEADPEGPFMIAEHPIRDRDGNPYHNLYVAATDSYDQDESYTTTSQGSCWVKKRFLNSESTYNTYVAGVVERPKTAEGGKNLFYEHTALLTMYYFCKNLVEWSKILITEWYIRNGLEGLLKERPEFVLAKMIEKSKGANFYGIDPSTKIHWLTMMAEYLNVRENIEKCMFPELLKAWAKFKYAPGRIRYNCDITISTSLCETYAEDIREMEVISESEIEADEGMPVFKMQGGKIVQTW